VFRVTFVTQDELSRIRSQTVRKSSDEAGLNAVFIVSAADETFAGHAVSPVTAAEYH
jgi:hypothetical protein